MNNLLQLAFWKNKYKSLMAAVLLFMCLTTVATQLEVFAIGFLTQKGPEFFRLFGTVTDQGLQPVQEVSKEQLLYRFSEITKENILTQGNVNAFLAKKQVPSVVDRAFSFAQNKISLQGNIPMLAALIAFIAAFKAIIMFFHRYLTKILAIRISQDLRQQFFKHIQKLPMPFYDRYNIGSLSSRAVTDSLLVSEAVNAVLINYIQTPFTALSTLILCFMTSWKLTCWIFLGLPLIAMPIYFLAKKVKKYSSQLLRKQEHFTATLIDYISGIQTVKMFSMGDYSLKKYVEQNTAMANLEKKSALYDLSSRPIVHTIAMLFVSSTVITALYVENMNISEALVFCGLLYIFYEPVKKFAEENSHIQKGSAAADRMFEVLGNEKYDENEEGKKDLEEFAQSIQFHNVSFKYQNEWVLRNLSFSIPKGKMVALVGATGAGKSTIIQLLTRLYDPQEGKILIDDIPLECYSKTSVRKQFAAVPQKPFLFEDTVLNNITVGQDYSIQDVIQAAQNAQAHEFIEKLSCGYNTPVSEAGKNLSGGQLQRLTIARALLRKTPVLIMDEATSALDVLSEGRIKQVMHVLKNQGVTQIIVAHRLTTIEEADWILFLEDGRLAAEGSREHLLENSPSFRMMWETMYRQSVKKEAV